MKLTKKERCKYYKKAIERVKDGRNYERFICIALRNIVNERKDEHIGADEVRIIFKEFGEKIPSSVSWLAGSWWREEDIESRITVLKKCVKETSPNPKK